MEAERSDGTNRTVTVSPVWGKEAKTPQVPVSLVTVVCARPLLVPCVFVPAPPGVFEPVSLHSRRFPVALFALP